MEWDEDADQPTCSGRISNFSSSSVGGVRGPPSLDSDSLVDEAKALSSQVLPAWSDP